MKIERRRLIVVLALALLLTISSATSPLRAVSGVCSGANFTLPFTDVLGNAFFCQIAAAYFSGLTNGTTATTYSPTVNVTREQMAAFITRTQDAALRRGSKRAFMQQWWRPADADALRPISTPTPQDIVFDGADLWVINNETVSRVRASDGQVLGSWTGAVGARGIIAATGRIFITGRLGDEVPGRIYVIDPTSAPGAVTVFASGLGKRPHRVTFDGKYLWTADLGGSLSQINVATGAVSLYTAGFPAPIDILWDGANLWVADNSDSNLKRVKPDFPLQGTVLESIPLGDSSAHYLMFDGANLWVSNFGNDSVTVVRAVGGLRGTVLATLTGNGLDAPRELAFDGEHVLVTNYFGNSVSLFKATDFTPLGTAPIGANSLPLAACSDGANFWIVRTGTQDIVRF